MKFFNESTESQTDILTIILGSSNALILVASPDSSLRRQTNPSLLSAMPLTRSKLSTKSLISGAS